jgi:hypothetical protein
VVWGLIHWHWALASSPFGGAKAPLPLLNPLALGFSLTKNNGAKIN